MKRPCTAALLFVALWFPCGSMFGQQPNARDRVAAQRAADENRRDWLRKNLPRLISNQQDLNAALAQVDRMDTDQLNDAVSTSLDELAARGRQQFAKLRELNARERAFRDELARAMAFQPPFAPVAPIGYYPIVTWLPEGVSLSTQAFVSPDRRSVRMSLMPFFSTIGPVYTFNFMTGETRRLPEFDRSSQGSPPPQSPPPRERPGRY